MCRLVKLESDTNILKRIRLIQKELLCNGAYSEKNLESQEKQFDRLNVPDWEKEINRLAYSVKRKQSHKLLKELESLLQELEKNDA